MARMLRCCWRQLAEHGTAPAARSSHSVTAVGGKVCVFGGEDAPRNAFDAFPHFLGPDGTWERGGSPHAVPGGPLLGHGAAALGSRLFVFGGRTGGANTFSGVGTAGETGELLVFDSAGDCGAGGGWTRWDPAGREKPEPRSFHAMCEAADPDGGANGHLYVFGGCGASGRLNDLWRFDPQGDCWQCLHPGGGAADAPLPRGGARLVASMDGSRLLLLFGFSGAQQGDIASFDLKRQRWELLPREAQHGEVPAPRSVFAAAVARGPGAQGEAIVFGGERVASDLGHAGAGEFAADLYALDLETLRWRALAAEGPVPLARGWAGMAPWGANRFLLFGGLDAENARLGDAWELVLGS